MSLIEGDIRWMHEAVRAAMENVDRAQGGPFGAVVVRDGMLIARGANRVTSTNDPTAHAEVVAIREACRVLDSFQLTGCDIYTTCEPCPMCMGAIYWARPNRVYYAASRVDAAEAGFDDELIYRELALDPALRQIPSIQIGREEGRQVFSAWLAHPDRIPY